MFLGNPTSERLLIHGVAALLETDVCQPYQLYMFHGYPTILTLRVWTNWLQAKFVSVPLRTDGAGYAIRYYRPNDLPVIVSHISEDMVWEQKQLTWTRRTSVSEINDTPPYIVCFSCISTCHLWWINGWLFDPVSGREHRFESSPVYSADPGLCTLELLIWIVYVKYVPFLPRLYLASLYTLAQIR